MFDILGFDAIVCERLTITLLHFLILTFTDSAEPVPEQKWTPFGNDAKRWPKPRDVLLGKTELGFAHLLLPPLADKEWPACEEHIKERLREHLRLVSPF